MAGTTKDISAWELGGIDSGQGIDINPKTNAGSQRIRTIGYASGISRIAQTTAVNGASRGITIYIYDLNDRYIGIVAKNVSVYANFDYTTYQYRIDLARKENEDLKTAFSRYTILDSATETEYYQWNPALFSYKSPNDGLYYGNVVGNLGLREFVFHIQSLDQEILDGIDEVGDDLINQVNTLASKYTKLLSIMQRVNSEITNYFGSIFILGTSMLDDTSAPLG